MKKLMSTMLIVVLLCAILSTFALLTATATEGTTGDCSWKLVGTVLTISGDGAMGDYSSSPWVKYSITEAHIEPGVTNIGKYAFNKCVALKTVTIADTVTTIGVSAFDGCEKLKSVTIPDSVTVINDKAFYLCKGLETVTIGNGVTTIGKRAFYHCTGQNTGLTTLTLGNNVETIGDYAFAGCDKLTAVTLPAGVTAIGQFAFNACAGLTSLTIPDGVTSISTFAFEACSGLATLNVGKGLATVDPYAFDQCAGLTDVHFNGTEEEWKQVTVGSHNEPLSRATVHYVVTHTHSYDNACDTTCNECGEIRPVGDHVYTNACDPDCNVCGATRTVGEHVYTNVCDPNCDICGAARTVNNHVYENACDPTCNVCGTFRTAPHSYDNACDINCNLCGLTRTTTHSFGEYVYNNDATLEKDGTSTRKCSVCGYSETIPAPGTKLVLSNPFTDVKAGAYYEKGVLWAVAKGVTKGTSATTFSPNKPCSRGEIVTFLWRANGCPEPQTTSNPFTDVKAGAYYSKAVLWAVEKGVTAGTAPDKFSPNADCTREQIVTFLWRSQGKPVMGSANPFKDVKGGTYYYNAVLWAVNEQITNGTSPTTFAPKADCTRGQIVTFLYRCLA